ncbi:hypothetical protein AAMO2058_000183300 [Amorphochlora amoebiformis]
MLMKIGPESAKYDRPFTFPGKPRDCLQSLTLALHTFLKPVKLSLEAHDGSWSWSSVSTHRNSRRANVIPGNPGSLRHGFRSADFIQLYCRRKSRTAITMVVTPSHRSAAAAILALFACIFVLSLRKSQELSLSSSSLGRSRISAGYAVRPRVSLGRRVRATVVDSSEGDENAGNKEAFQAIIDKFREIRSDKPAVVIGAGVSGLLAAKELKERNFNVTVLEASDGVGGRVRTDKIDGFQLDRGFHVFLDAYPDVEDYFREAGYRKMKLKPFLPGALVYTNGEFAKVSDPLRRPQDLSAALAAPVGNIFDKLKIGIYRLYANLASLKTLNEGREKSTYDYLRDDQGLSEDIIEKFFRPFYRGIFLSELEDQSSYMFNFVFKMLADGSAMLPQEGIGKVSDMLAESLKDDIRLNTRVAKVEPGLVTLESGEKLDTSYIIVATDGATASRLLEGNGLGVSSPEDRRSACFYYQIDGKPPFEDPMLVLNAEKLTDAKPVNNVAFLSNVDPSYAPNGKSLASVTVIDPNKSPEEMEDAVKGHLKDMFGDQVSGWKLLKTYEISGAQPGQRPPNKGFEKPVKVCEGVYCCGDHMDTPTLNGAFRSAMKAADAVSADRGSKRYEVLEPALKRLK